MKALASTFTALSALVVLTGCGAAGEAGLSASDGWSGPSDTMSCDDLAAHAVGMSEAQGAKVQLRLTVDADGDEFVHYGLVEHQPLSAQSAL